LCPPSLTDSYPVETNKGVLIHLQTQLNAVFISAGWSSSLDVVTLSTRRRWDLKRPGKHLSRESDYGIDEAGLAGTKA
jgi:hypothetical protein